jgi:ketosteroid isomerase-like protein
MKRCAWMMLMCAVAACGRSANVPQERDRLMAVDREWSQTTKDLDKFVSYYAPDASVYAPGMPVVTGAAKIRETFSEMASAPGFALQWTAAKADVGGAADLGYTSGTYQMTMNGVTDKGKYVTVWKKQSDGSWKALEDIINSDLPPAGASGQNAAADPKSLQWGPAPPSLPAGAKLAVVSGDPGTADAFVLRLQLPANYRVAPHWHPTDEHVTVLSGTFALGMGDNFDAAAAKDVPTGGYEVLPARMHHYALARTATTLQIHGIGPFVLNYVNPADDPSGRQK